MARCFLFFAYILITKKIYPGSRGLIISLTANIFIGAKRRLHRGRRPSENQTTGQKRFSLPCKINMILLAFDIRAKNVNSHLSHSESARVL